MTIRPCSTSIRSRSNETLPLTRQQSLLSSRTSVCAPVHPKQFVAEIDGFLQRLESLHARSAKCRESLARIEVDFESLAPAMERKAIYCTMDSDEMEELVGIRILCLSIKQLTCEQPVKGAIALRKNCKTLDDVEV